MRQYYHIGIPTTEPRDNEKYFETIKLYSSGYDSSEYGIEWLRYEDDCKIPEIIKKVPHIAFIVDDLDVEIMLLTQVKQSDCFFALGERKM